MQVALIAFVVVLGLWALLVVVVWLASPIDLIPEFLPVIGPLDDIVVSAIVLRWVGRRVGVDALRAHCPGRRRVRAGASTVGPIGGVADQFRRPNPNRRPLRSAGAAGTV